MTNNDNSAPLIEIALLEPEIPPNTGNIMRLCANVPARLHLIEPLGFVLDDRRLRRAGLDYRDQMSLVRHPGLGAFAECFERSRWLAFTTRAQHSYADWVYASGDVLLFGPETRGLPQELLDSLPPERCLRIPQQAGARSLNLSNSVAVAAYEAWRQMDFRGGC